MTGLKNHAPYQPHIDRVVLQLLLLVVLVLVLAGGVVRLLLCNLDKLLGECCCK